MKIGILLLVLLLPFTSFYTFNSRAQVISTSSTIQNFAVNNQTCEQCNVLSNAISPIVQTPKFGNDLGQLQTHYSLNGNFSMQNIYGSNLSVSPSSGLTFTNSYQNGSSVSYSTGRYWYHFDSISNGFGQNISITGTTPTALPVILSLKLSCNSQLTNSSDFAVSCGNESFQWDATNFLSYNNSTNIISWQVQGTFVIDPLALDGSANCKIASGSTSCSATITSTNSPDVCIVQTGGNNGGMKISSITGTGLTFHNRASSTAAGPSLIENYTIASSPLSSVSITVTITSNTNSPAEVIVFCVSGAQTTGQIFDPNAAIPVSVNHQTTSATMTISGISTSNANDFVVAEFTQGSSNTFTAGNIAGSAATSIQAPQQTAHSSFAEYRILSSTISSQTATSGGGGATWSGIVDAIESGAAPVSFLIKTTTLNGSPVSNITLSGCSTKLYLADGNFHNITGATASSSCTATVKADTATTRYRFGNGTIAKSTYVFPTCAINPCTSITTNNLYWQIDISYESWAVNTQPNYTANSQNFFNSWLANYNNTVTTSYVGNTNTSCLILDTFGSTNTACNNAWSDANTTSTWQITPTFVSLGAVKVTYNCQFVCSYKLSNSTLVTLSVNYYYPSPSLANTINYNPLLALLTLCSVFIPVLYVIQRKRR